jgi:dihydrofolate synthase/folylpolyglutamate synthase
MTYRECINYLYRSLPVYQRIGASAYKANLDNTLALMEHFGHPEKKFQSIHVAGTNGKGSVSHVLASIHQEAGYKTGLYTSPHLKDFRERIRVNGKKVSQQFVIDFTEKNMTFFKELQPSFFEMTVALAFLYFAYKKVDIAIIEVGMGGRLDSTNVITPQLSIITNISYDHTQFLGKTLADIAREKGGIIKENVPVIIGETHPETASIFKQMAAEKKSSILFADQVFRTEKVKTVLEPTGFWMHFKMRTNKYLYRRQFLSSNDFWTYNKLRADNLRFGDETFISPLAGDYQLNNLKTIFAACLLTGEKRLSQKDVKNGIKNCIVNTKLMGRWQVLQQNPLCIADTGHNLAGIKYVVEQIAQIPCENLHFVLSMVNDKDIREILSLLPQDAKYYFCKAKIPRGLDPHILKEQSQWFNLNGKIYRSVKSAYNEAKRSAGKNDLIIVGGSNFTVAEVV